MSPDRLEFEKIEEAALNAGREVLRLSGYGSIDESSYADSVAAVLAVANSSACRSAAAKP